MNCLARRLATRSRLNPGKQLRRSHDDSLAPAAALKDITLWKVASFVGCFFLVGAFIKTITAPHHHFHAVPYPHLGINNNSFPWGDGKTGVFHHLFGNPYAEEEDAE